MSELNSNEPKQSWLKSASLFVLEGVKDHLKGVIGAAVVGALVAVGLYVWSGQAAWLLAIALYLFAFFVGVVVTLSLLGFIGFRTVLKTREQAAAFAAQFVSKEKGFFDYFVELDEVQPQFSKTLSGIANEMGKIGDIAIGIDLPALTAEGSKAVVSGLARAAREIVHHSKNMSNQQAELELLLSRMTEATNHQVQSTFIDVKGLPPVRAALFELRARVQTAREGMTNWRITQQNVYGMSQEMNTCVNHMLTVTEGIIATLQTSEHKWTDQLAIVDARLLSQPTNELS